MNKLNAHIKRNLNKVDFFKVNVTKVSTSGMTRRMKVYVIYKGELHNITHMVAEATGWNQNENGVSVQGCGMDMCFHMLDTYVGKAFRTHKRPHHMKAVQHYHMI